MDVTERPALEVRAYKPVSAPTAATNKQNHLHALAMPTYPGSIAAFSMLILPCLSCYPMQHGLPNDAFRPSAFGSLPKQSELPAKEDGRGHQVIGSERRASGM